MTLLLLWYEYRDQHPRRYEYSWFCWHYRKWAGKPDLVMQQNHKDELYPHVALLNTELSCESVTHGDDKYLTFSNHGQRLVKTDAIA